MMRPWSGMTEAGELALREESAGRLLSTAIYARWNSTPAEKARNDGG